MKRLKRSYLLAVLLVTALGVGLAGCGGGGGDGGRKGYESEAETIPYAELVKDPAAFEGTKAKFQGQVVRIIREEGPFEVEGGPDSGNIVHTQDFYLAAGAPLTLIAMKQLRQQSGKETGRKFHIVVVHWSPPEPANIKPGKTVTVLGEMEEELFNADVSHGNLGSVPRVDAAYVDSFRSEFEPE